MKRRITVIGGANFDMSAALSQPFVANDSNPSHITFGYGGVGRNIAHNLCLLGEEVRFVSVFGNDIFGSMMHDNCKTLGMDMKWSMQVKGERTGLYLCINNHTGEMIAAVSDTDILSNLTAEYIEKHMSDINNSDAIVVDANISEDCLHTIIDNASVPIYADVVSTAKAWRIVNALKKSKTPRLRAIKLNIKEALTLTQTQNAEAAALCMVNMGVENVYITLGSEGVLCVAKDMDKSMDGGEAFASEHVESSLIVKTYPALPGEVVNTTGAGDAFLAGVIHAELQGIRFPETAQYGLMAARATLMSEQAVNPNIANILL